MKDWHTLKPELFKKQPYYRPGCDTKTFSGDHHVNTAATKPTAFTRHAFVCISQFHIITTARQISHR
jgi:hypothetical protein